MILWYMSVEKYFSLTPGITTEAKSATISECILEAGSTQIQWADAVAESIVLEEKDAHRDLQELGESEEAFEQAVLRFFKKCGMPEVTGDDQKRYTQHALKKCPTLEPRAMITWLESINRYIQYIPMTAGHDEDRAGDWLRGTTPFIEKELMAILIRMIQRKWSTLETELKKIYDVS